MNPVGGLTKTFRLRIVTTKEYTAHFGGTSGASAQVTTTINRVNEVYRREVSFTFQLLSIDALTGGSVGSCGDYPFDDDPAVNSGFLTANNVYLDCRYGEGATFDIGHVLAQGSGGGLAERGSTCTSNKGRGGTKLTEPSGDPFDVD